MNAMKDDQLETMRNDPTSAIFYNEMFMNGSQD